MKYIADLHLHSKYARACSKELELPQIQAACLEKGVDIIGTGDFTHPGWFKHLKDGLVEDGNSGLYVLKNNPSKVHWMLSSEVALIYKDKGKTRRIHLVMHAPSLEAAAELNRRLGDKFNLKSDGRPILGIRAPELVKHCLEVHPQFLVYPAHIWTPWFAVFGSKSGFDRLEDCFEDQTENIFAYETGLSSDPEMNWRVSQLDNLVLLSNSDAHSPRNIAREANILDLDELSYARFYKLLKNREKQLVKTIEFYPEEGMYHWDGHSACGFSCPPAESKRLDGLCPKCSRPLIIGVEYRVEELADRPTGIRPEGMSDFVKLVELDKIIAESLGIKSRSSKAVLAEYHQLIKAYGPELTILMDLPLDRLAGVNPRIVEGIRRVRTGELTVVPGFDGQYGVVRIFKDEERLKQLAIV